MMLDWYGYYAHPWYVERLARWNARVITAPVVEPITLAEVRLQCRIDAYPVYGESPELDAHPDDPLIETLISAAREYCEAYTGRALAPQVLEVSRAFFPVPNYVPGADAIQLPMAPVRAIQSVLYPDGEGGDLALTADDYLVDFYGNVPHILPPVSGSWPILSSPYPNAVRIRYEAGYAVESESPDVVPMVPASIKAAMKLIVADLYAHREHSSELRLGVIPLGAECLLRPYRLHLGVA